MFYQRIIAQILRSLGRADVHPAHVEAHMLVGHSTLDGLSPREFAAEVRLCVDAVDEGGRDQADDLARSYGLVLERCDAVDPDDGRRCGMQRGHGGAHRHEEDVT